MSRTINLKNNFNSFEQDFTKDTGLKKGENPEAYINYVTARLIDKNVQMNWHIMEELMNVPKNTAFHIGMNDK